MSQQANSYEPGLQKSLAEEIASLTPAEQDRIFQGLTEEQSKATLYDWRGFWARPKQVLPDGDWVFWLILAGRGFGKTRTGAEAVREWAADPKQRILMIARNPREVRQTMIEGPAGIMRCYPPESRPVYYPALSEIRFPSGAVGIIRSAEEPESLRGPEFGKFWADELCAWQYGGECWEQLMYGFRQLGKIQGVITTTPKPIPFVSDHKGGKVPLIKQIMELPETHVTRGSSYENRRNLSQQFYKTTIAPREGTRLGRQEIFAELLLDVPGALWTQELIERSRVSTFPMMVRIVVAIDPAVTATDDSDETGIIVAGVARDQHVYVFADGSGRQSPGEWARSACRLLLKWDADRIVAEVNNGGDLVETNIRAVHPAIPYRAVRASRGKAVRAEPVAALYEQGKVHHVGCFGTLEDQMCAFVPGMEGKSPDRMDALVWAIYDLVLQPLESGTLTYESGYSISPI